MDTSYPTVRFLKRLPGGHDPRSVPVAWWLFWFVGLAGLLCSAQASWARSVDLETRFRVIQVEGTAEVRQVGAEHWIPLAKGAQLQPGDQVRTGVRSRVTFLEPRQRSQWVLHESGRLELAVQYSRPIVKLLDEAWLYFFHRGRPRGLGVEAGNVNAGVEGTEFSVRLESDGTVTLAVFDGLVVMNTPEGSESMGSGDIGVARPGQRPVKQTAVLMYGDFSLIQWALYYPAVLNLEELDWSPPGEAGVGESLEAYRRGNLPAALAAYPAARQPESEAERVYLAAIVLASGGVEEARGLLQGVQGEGRLRRLAGALERLIAAVLRQDCDAEAGIENGLATEWLAASYGHQARGRLREALEAARQATETAAGFGFGWARRAELEFSFGRVRAASGMAERAVALTPENAEALTLQGFVAAAQNRIGAAQGRFEQALAIDGALGNAWLGRGLCRIRRGDLEGGRLDLLTAAALEPQRSLLRSYLGKAYADSQWFRAPAMAAEARHEWELARRLDPLDPTPWLYQSLLEREENRINAAIRANDRAQDLTDNRGLYRSGLLLDQDRAVAGANQALAYRDAGMSEVAVRSASRAVATDYANPAAHQFLAESYGPSTPATLRYETARLSEYLVANLLAPVGGGLLSPTLSQQEYSKLFERDRTGLYSQTTYLSRGAWSQTGGVLDTHGGTSVLTEGFYLTDPGYAPNNDLEQYGFTVQLKQQVGPRDTVYGQVFYTDLDAGDIALRYDPQAVDPYARVTERVWPGVVGGWHRAWSPEHHSLFLAGWVEGESAGYNVPTYEPMILREQRSDAALFTSEAQHIWAPEGHTIVAGVRWQAGSFEVSNVEESPLVVMRNQQYRPDFERFQIYGYETWEVRDRVHLTAGLSYDRIEFPINHAEPPLRDGEDWRSKVSPKVGAIWEVLPRTWLRAAYTRSLGGVSYDQSFRLEPTQVAGFNQAYRTLLPESVAATGPAPTFETLGLALELRLMTNTWVTLSAERHTSESRSILDHGIPLRPNWVTVERTFEERTFQATLHQLLDEHWSLGARYRISGAELERSDAPLHPSNQAILQSLSLSAHFNHRSGLFASAEGLWMHQHNSRVYHRGGRGSSGTVAALPSEDLWQINLWGGWRFLRRRAEILVGVLNVTDADYRLNPISVTVPPERERTFVTRLSFHY